MISNKNSAMNGTRESKRNTCLGEEQSFFIIINQGRCCIRTREAGENEVLKIATGVKKHVSILKQCHLVFKQRETGHTNTLIAALCDTENLVDLVCPLASVATYSTFSRFGKLQRASQYVARWLSTDPLSKFEYSHRRSLMKRPVGPVGPVGPLFAKKQDSVSNSWGALQKSQSMLFLARHLCVVA